MTQMNTAYAGESLETAQPPRLSLIRFTIVSFFLCFAVLMAVYMPAWTIPYAHHDQFRYFTDPGTNSAFKQSCGNDPEYFFLYAIGRPLSAKSECIIFEHSNRLSDLLPFRVGVILLLALAAVCYARVLRNCGLGPVESAALSLGIYTLPGAQNAVFMTTFANPAAVLTATLAHSALHEADKRYRRGFVIEALGLLAVAGMLLLVSLLFYPFWSLFFFCCTLAYVIFQQDRKRLWGAVVVLRDVVFFAVAGAAYYAIWHLLLLPRNAASLARIPPQYQAKMSLAGIVEKFHGLVIEITPRVLALWSIQPSHLIAAAVALTVCGGLLIYLWRGGVYGDSAAGSERVVTVLAVLILLFTANGLFLISPAFFLLRLFFVFGAMLVMLLFWSLQQIVSFYGISLRRFPSLFAWASVLLCFIGSTAALATTNENILNSYTEFAFIKQSIAAEAHNLDRIHIVQPRTSTRGFNGLPAEGDEFNGASTAYPHFLDALIRLAFVEMGAQSKYVVDGEPWLAQAEGHPACRITPAGAGALKLTDQHGATVDATVDGRLIHAPQWGITGVLTPDLTAIRWSNGIIWGRRDQASLAGSWTVRAPEQGEHVMGSASVSVLPGDTLLLRNGNRQTEAVLRRFELRPFAWNEVGVANADGSEIRWTGGTTWEREGGAPIRLEGTWAALPGYTPNQLMVTYSPADTSFIRSPNMLVIDMNELQASVWGWPHRPRDVRPTGSISLATGKAASQSSTYAPNLAAAKAVDGNTDGRDSANSLSHTQKEAHPWWEVDLGASANIDSIMIWNRSDSFRERLSDYWVFVSDAPFAPTDTPAILQGRPGTWSGHQTAAPNPSSEIPVDTLGRYIRVQLSGTDYLTLAEVQVVGNWATGSASSKAAMPRYRSASAFASSHAAGFDVSALNDGTPAAWGSAEGKTDVYFGLEFPAKEGVRFVRITAFSPQGRAHLREFSVVASDSPDPSSPDWHIVHARIQGGTTFDEKITVPPVVDNTVITVEVDPRDPNAGPHQIWALACLSQSRGYARNYLKVGDGIYVRELEMAPGADRH